MLLSAETSRLKFEETHIIQHRMPREPLVFVHVALLDKLADNIHVCFSFFYILPGYCIEFCTILLSNQFLTFVLFCFNLISNKKKVDSRGCSEISRWWVNNHTRHFLFYIIDSKRFFFFLWKRERIYVIMNDRHQVFSSDLLISI